MKKNITILVGVVAIVVVLFGGYKLVKKYSVEPEIKVEAQGDVSMKSFSGSVTRVYEGDNILSYTFDIPETATTTLEMDNALVKIVDNSIPYATVYISYEGGRGFTPLDYISEVIAPHVAVINPTEISTIGNYAWQVAESEGSEWYVASINNGNWLFIVENKKTKHDLVAKTLESVKIIQKEAIGE